MIKRFDLVETFNSEIKVHNRLAGTYIYIYGQWGLFYLRYLGLKKKHYLGINFFHPKNFVNLRKNVLARLV